MRVQYEQNSAGGCNGINYQCISYASDVIAILRYEKNYYCPYYNNESGKIMDINVGEYHVFPNSSRQQILLWIQEKSSKEFLKSTDGTIDFNMWQN